MKADGAPINIQEVVHVDPEFDERTANRSNMRMTRKVAA